MPALTLNGLTIPVLADTFEEQTIDSGDVFARASTGKMFGSLGVRKRRWRFRTKHLDASTAKKLRLFIEGNSLSWSFNGGLIGSAGVSNTNPCDGSFVAGWLGQGLALNDIPTGWFSVDMSNKVNVPNGWTPGNGWTLMFRVYQTVAADGVPADGWYHYIVTTDYGVSVTAGASANPDFVTQYRYGVAGSYNLGRIFNVSSSGNLVGVAGFDLSGSPAVRTYDELVFFPFGLPTTVAAPWSETWAIQLYDESVKGAWPSAPIMRAAGDHIDRFSNTLGVDVVCRIESIEHINATMPGSTSKPNVKVMDVVMEEV